jgi:hypothetical protein
MEGRTADDMARPRGNPFCAIVGGAKEREAAGAAASDSAGDARAARRQAVVCSEAQFAANALRIRAKNPRHDTCLTLGRFKNATWSQTMLTKTTKRAGKIKYALLGWLIGLPLPIIIILLFVRGCDF